MSRLARIEGLKQPDAFRLDAGHLERLSINRLRTAIRHRKIVPVFQPIVDLHSGKTTSCEVLARWQDSDLGEISPEIFVPVAERAGLLDEMMEILLQPVADAMHRSPDTITFAINVSPSQMRKPWFAARLLLWIDRLDIPAHRLILEITEAVLICDFAAVNKTLKALRSHGIRIALDDFGTGYSNLQYLYEIDCDIVKIDRCFVEKIGRITASEKIIQAVVGLGSGLGFTVTAEGVENLSQAQLLKQLGCDQGQGYVFSRPVGVEAFIKANGVRPAKLPMTRLVA